MDVPMQGGRRFQVGKSGGSLILRGRSESRKAHKADDATLPRKASKEWDGYPYRKPTQVGEEKILRRKCDHAFRNSANWPRNFGRRGAPVA